MFVLLKSKIDDKSFSEAFHNKHVTTVFFLGRNKTNPD